MRKGDLYGAEDFVIGALQGHTDNIDVIEIVTRIRSFQAGLSQGTIPLDDVHPSWKTQSQRIILFYLDRGNVPLDVRVGLVNIYEPGKANANIRFSGEPGIAFGEIYLTKELDNWLVSDLQIDLADLAENPQVREGIYEPSLYRIMNLP